MSLPTVKLCDGRDGVRTNLEVQTCAAGEGAAVLDFVASSATLDRYHEIIEPAGWRLDTYRKNPVFQNAHNYGDVIFTLGKALVTEVRGGHLFQRIEFATEVNPMARIAYGLYKGGFLRAVSVGFIPVRWENGAPEAPYRRKYLEQELLELSAVAIPANPDALALGVKSGVVERGSEGDARIAEGCGVGGGEECGDAGVRRFRRKCPTNYGFRTRTAPDHACMS